LYIISIFFANYIKISINKEISSNLVTFLLIELSKNDITQSNTKEFLSSIKDNEFVKKFVYTVRIKILKITFL